MALYAYEAYSKDGKKMTGTIDASSLGGAREQLGAQGLYIVAISPTQEGAGQSFLTRLFARGVSVKEKVLFTKQLAVLLRSGVPLLQSFELLTEQFDGAFKTIIISIKDDVKQGISLAESLKKFPAVFDTIYVQLVRAGEASGRLEIILERLTDYIERQEEVRKKVKGAMQYPLIQLGIAVVVVIVLLTAVVPQLQGIFEQQGANLPTSTKIMIAASDAIKNHYLMVLLFFIAITAVFSYWKRTQSGARTWDTLIIKLPLIKYIAKTNAVVQFSYTLGMLLEGGVSLAEALDIVTRVIDNRILADSVSQARDKIIKQGKIAQYLKQTNLFPSVAIYLIGTGEETGQLDKMLLVVAQNYEAELKELIDRMTALIGPIMMVVMALIVGFIVMAIAGPMMSLGEAFNV